MGLFKKFAAFLGIARDEGQNEDAESAADASISSSGIGDAAAASTAVPVQRHPRKGFSVPVQVPVERPQSGPVIVPCNSSDGGLQGLKWYVKRLRIDEDGDVADEFIDEVLADATTSMENCTSRVPMFEVKSSTKPAKVRNLALSPNGKIQHLVEIQGRLEWV